MRHAKEESIYAISLATSASKEKVIEAFGQLDIEGLSLVGSNEPLDFTQDKHQVIFKLPLDMNMSNGFAVKAVLKNHH